MCTTGSANPQRQGRALRGAEKVVGTCLGLLPGEELLIIADETTLAPSQLIYSAAVTKLVHATMLLVPSDDQVRLATGSELPLPIQAAMRDARAILTCVGDQPEAMKFRATIIRTGKSHQTKVGNCPGINLQMLSTAVDVNYTAMASRCNLLAIALVRSKSLRIQTEDALNRSCALDLALGYWARIPVTSNGIIEEGVWGNIPSGETYLAPLEGSAEGEIIINGSLPGYVFPDGEEIKLTFRQGALVSTSPQGHPATEHLQARLRSACLEGDTSCLQLAEVGIGVNPRIGKLSGKPLMDEKKAGTAHIALGDNTDFGGTLSSSVHLDLTTQSPTIVADGKTLLEQEQLVVREADWCANYLDTTLPEPWVHSVQAVGRTGHRINTRNARLLERELIDGSGRVLHIPVGDTQTAAEAMSVYSRIPLRELVPLDRLIPETRLDRTQLLKLLKVMEDYEMVRFELAESY